MLSKNLFVQNDTDLSEGPIDTNKNIKFQEKNQIQRNKLLEREYEGRYGSSVL